MQYFTSSGKAWRLSMPWHSFFSMFQTRMETTFGPAFSAVTTITKGECFMCTVCGPRVAVVVLQIRKMLGESLWSLTRCWGAGFGVIWVSWHDGNEQAQEFSLLRQTEQYHWEALAENRVVQQALILSSAPNLIDPCDSHHQCWKFPSSFCAWLWVTLELWWNPVAIFSSDRRGCKSPCSFTIPVPCSSKLSRWGEPEPWHVGWM